MKNRFLFLGFVLVSLSAKAQTLYVPSGTSGVGTSSNSNVGIGTTSPGAKLEVVGPSTGTGVSVFASGGGDVMLNTSGSLFFDGNYSYGTGNYIRPVASNTQAFFTSGVERFRITSFGNVGVGTTSPGLKLNVLGVTGDSNTGILGIDGSGANASLRLGVNTNYSWIQAHGSRPLYINELGNNTILNLNGGNLGIGTSTPNAGLEVFKGSTNDLALQVNSSGPGWGSGMRFKNSAATGKTWGIYTGSDGIWRFSNVDAGTDAIVVKANNYVGIGTSVPDYPLTVNGSIHAKEVRVDLSVPGPDYVFANDYKLPSLEEIKNYIDENKHLPEVPSAAAMEKNGVQLGEMNMLLLRKIEELTLYLIEQNKFIDKLKEERRVSPDPSGKKIEELTLYVIELKKENQKFEQQGKEIQVIKEELESLKKSKRK